MFEGSEWTCVHVARWFQSTGQYSRLKQEQQQEIIEQINSLGINGDYLSVATPDILKEYYLLLSSPANNLFYSYRLKIQPITATILHIAFTGYCAG